MLDIGRLDKRITFQKQAEETGKYGQTKKVFKDYKTVWATVKALRGTEYYEALRVRPETTYKITCRFLKGLAPEMRIKCKLHGEVKYFEIIGKPNDVNSAGEYLEFEAKEYTYAREDDIYVDADGVQGE